jgi:hypothetical protein
MPEMVKPMADGVVLPSEGRRVEVPETPEELLEV